MKSKSQSGVALVITLLMLSVITFLTVAFLAVSRRDRASVGVSLTQREARTMADAALARAQSEIIARMMATTDLLSYDLMVSRNFINPGGFDPNSPTNANNVNYDYITNRPGTRLSGDELVVNVANLMYDPRPPVYYKTADPNSNEFRFFIDLNRNRRFETNGYLPILDDNGDPVVVNKVTQYDNFYGEPEWIGVLRNPDQLHSSSNLFIGRYAFLVLPIGKTLDLNFIHNYSKVSAQSPPMRDDYFFRDQGVGSWELNLGAFLRNLNPSGYSNLATLQYTYYTNNVANGGDCFVDAKSFLSNRYNGQFTTASLETMRDYFGNTGMNYMVRDGINSYPSMQRGGVPFFGYSSTTDPDLDRATGPCPWPGSDNPNAFYNLQEELFDTNKYYGFVHKLTNAVAQLNSTNRYTFSRLLASIGTDSAPELQTRIQEVVVTNNLLVTNEYVFTKVNLNYDNTYEITNHLNSATTNFIPWTPLAFFTNAADLILRSQFNNDTNYVLTNLWVYSSTNANITYTPAIHRCLQLAANLYDASTNGPNGGTNVPSVFRPHFTQHRSTLGSSNIVNLYIDGYEEVTNNGLTLVQQPFRYPYETNVVWTNANVWGMPWVVGVKKGLPNFNEFVASNSFSISRKLEFTKNKVTDTKILSTNQTFYLTMTNMAGLELWNSYTQAAFPRQVRVIVSNLVSISLTNNARGRTNIYITNSPAPLIIAANQWLRYGEATNKNFQIPLLTNIVVFPKDTRYVETTRSFTTNAAPTNNAGLPVYNWYIHLTNNLVYALVEDQGPNRGRLLDFVNLGNLTVSQDISYLLTNNPATASFNPWLTQGADATLGSRTSRGVSNQIDVCLGKLVETVPGFYANDEQARLSRDEFKAWWDGTTKATDSIRVAAPFQAFAVVGTNYVWQANDPLVHYTVGDLTSPQPSPISDIGQVNLRYKPWTTNVSQETRSMTFRDPNIKRPDDWEFPTNKYPNVGWIGRVHRGTPWQTIFLKADDSDPDRLKKNHENWPKYWVTQVNNLDSTYPTNDWKLVDLFTVAPNDNAARGTLSVNNTNLAAWSAVLSGVVALSNKNVAVVIHPTNVPAILDGVPGTTTSINAVREIKRSRMYHNIGEVLQAQTLTTQSPFVQDPFGEKGTNITDAVVERIPQQILSLLRVGEPRFVIWSYGQSLKPQGMYLDSKFPEYYKLCTNYQVTGESLTRTVCRVEGDPKNPKIVVESFNVVPGE